MSVCWIIFKQVFISTLQTPCGKGEVYELLMATCINNLTEATRPHCLVIKQQAGIQEFLSSLPGSVTDLTHYVTLGYICKMGIINTSLTGFLQRWGEDNQLMFCIVLRRLKCYVSAKFYYQMFVAEFLPFCLTGDHQMRNYIFVWKIFGLLTFVFP